MSVEFRTDLEEKLDVAQVQIEVSRSIFENPEMEQDLRQELVRQLNERLLTISEVRSRACSPWPIERKPIADAQRRSPAPAVPRLCPAVRPAREHAPDPPHVGPPGSDARGQHVGGHHREEYVITLMPWEDSPLTPFAPFALPVCEQSRDACVPVVAAKVAELGRRFFPSETAFPLDFLARRLESFAWETRAASSSAGWVPLALRQAGVDWERIFDVFYAAFEEKVRMPACPAPVLDLGKAADPLTLSPDPGRAVGLERGRQVPRQRRRCPAVALVSIPSRPVSLAPFVRLLTLPSRVCSAPVRLEDWSRSQSGYGPRSVSRFPALQVEEFVTNALLPCFVSDADADERKERLRALKRRIMASM